MRKGFLALTALVVAVGVFAVAGAATGETAPGHYTVAFSNPNGLPANVDQLVANAGGTITTRIPEIGGIGVSSDNPNFASVMGANASVKAVGQSVVASIGPTMEPSSLDAQAADAGNSGGTYSPAGPDPQPEPDSLGSQQWDKMRMNVSLTGSYAIQRGRQDVRVFVIDTGADLTHPDLATHFDAAESVSFVPSEPFVQDLNGHGTWTLSAIGAPINGIGTSGVAPNVTMVEGKVLSGAGSGQFLWTDQALVYAGLKHFDIVSASLGGYIPKCGSATNPNGCDHPDYILLNRATQFARSNGVLPVAALGNDNFDLSDGSVFRDYVEAPGEVAGWVGVAATGYYNQKAWYSNYGMGKSDVSAPGGSTRNYTGVPGSGAAPPPYLGIGRVLGPWSTTGSSTGFPDPNLGVEQCTGVGNTPPCYPYAWVQGTSMATPNTAGVASLIISQYGDFTSSNPNHSHMSPTAVEQILQITANNQPCPEPRTVIAGPGVVFPTSTCQGDVGYNSFFGKGIVDAVKAVTFHG
jgi:subtilisin family serine protease